ncbi:MAG: hypothetical protein PWR29_1212 [Methanolobus sp.]|jgi:uncharacterized protein with von Willebrand factor type A (vWA) domain|nr:hypothetical protein [Methanolobus sp.]MDK2833623.1 hypothetical protein [Methanolobus sp.]MDK2912255.1 hypothetical protein [Methanolobus sp.]MDN5308972.1 hypothetical protein [Methanolobus sp.]
MVRSIEDLEKDLDTMNEMFRKYVKLSEHYQKQVDSANIPEEQRRMLLEKLAQENEKVQKAKMQIETFERTIQTLKESREKLKEVVHKTEKPLCETEYLVAYN